MNVSFNFDPAICASCDTCDCLMRCQYMTFDLAEAKKEKTRINSGKNSRVLTDCATCYACEEYCPNGNHPFYLIVELQDELLLAFTAGKEALAVEGKVPPPVRDCLTKLQKYGNPYGLARKKRADWAVGTGVELFPDQEFLFFPGDVGAFDTRGQEIARSVTTLLHRLGVSFGILGTREVSDGNEANAMGESDLFCLLAEKNIRQFHKLNAKKIITLSPHGFNALKNDYPSLGGSYEVFHYTQILAKHTGSLSFEKNLPEETVTYHDPCYLGRHNGEYGSARKVLAALPGVKILEMDRAMQNALCCGGGGGNLFTDILGNGPESPAQNRVTEALGTDAPILAVSCPSCAVMLEDAVKSSNLDGRIQVREISEIVNNRLN